MYCWYSSSETKAFKCHFVLVCCINGIVVLRFSFEFGCIDARVPRCSGSLRLHSAADRALTISYVGRYFKPLSFRRISSRFNDGEVIARPVPEPPSNNARHEAQALELGRAVFPHVCPISEQCHPRFPRKRWMDHFCTAWRSTWSEMNTLIDEPKNHRAPNVYYQSAPKD